MIPQPRRPATPQLPAGRRFRRHRTTGRDAHSPIPGARRPLENESVTKQSGGSVGLLPIPATRPIAYRAPVRIERLRRQRLERSQETKGSVRRRRRTERTGQSWAVSWRSARPTGCLTVGRGSGLTAASRNTLGIRRACSHKVHGQRAGVNGTRRKARPTDAGFGGRRGTSRESSRSSAPCCGASGLSRTGCTTVSAF